ncbi:MAG TPA: nuclear transport factor 2 family protein [Candidatus Saccharimonas sp.]|nr:nuclear transport factor 2 family protein [Candidatus Saccharimonas sp.]
MQENFENFMKKRLTSSTAFIEGDAKPLVEISVTKGPASIFGPNGSVVNGADTVNKVNEKAATTFTAGGENSFEILHMAATDDLAYWTGIQRAKVKIKESGKLVPMDLRVTELFRPENGEWKLFHRHADMLKES